MPAYRTTSSKRATSTRKNTPGGIPKKLRKLAADREVALTKLAASLRAVKRAVKRGLGKSSRLGEARRGEARRGKARPPLGPMRAVKRWAHIPDRPGVVHGSKLMFPADHYVNELPEPRTYRTRQYGYAPEIGLEYKHVLSFLWEWEQEKSVPRATTEAVSKHLFNGDRMLRAQRASTKGSKRDAFFEDLIQFLVVEMQFPLGDAFTLARHVRVAVADKAFYAYDTYNPT